MNLVQAAVAPPPAVMNLVVDLADAKLKAKQLQRLVPLPQPVFWAELLDVLKRPPCDGPFADIPGAGKCWQKNNQNDWRKAVRKDYEKRGMSVPQDWDWHRHGTVSGW